MVIRDRRHLSEDGFVHPDHRHQQAHGPRGGAAGDRQPRLRLRWTKVRDLLHAARQVVARTLEASTAEERTDWGVMQEKIRADLKRYLTKRPRAGRSSCR